MYRLKAWNDLHGQVLADVTFNAVEMSEIVMGSKGNRDA
jgi:hypothetical protein